MILREYDDYFKRLIQHSKRFIDENARASGSFERVLNDGIDPRYINDYRCFAFTKSTKTLIGIYELLKLGNYEDTFALSRTIFECYLSERYFDDKYDADVQKDMVVIPTALADGLFIYKEGQVVRKDTNDSYEYTIKNPSVLTIGKDKFYFFQLYELLCEFAHCNISQFDSFLNENRECVLYTEKNARLAHLIALFSFSKLFESVVLLESTRFSDKTEEQACVDLLIELTEFLCESMEALCERKPAEGEGSAILSANTLRDMIKSLTEQLGRVEKDFVETIRKRHVETAIERNMKPALLDADDPAEFFESIKRQNRFSPRYTELEKLVGYAPNAVGEDAWDRAMKLLRRAAKRRAEADNPYAFMLSILLCGFDPAANAKGEPTKKDAERFLMRITNNDKARAIALSWIGRDPEELLEAAARGSGIGK